MSEKLRLKGFEILTALGRRGLLNFVPDRLYLKLQYRLKRNSS